jgi:hypothetical protein
VPIRADDLLQTQPEAYAPDQGCPDGLLPSCLACPLPECRLLVPPQQWRRTLARVRARLAAEDHQATIVALDRAGGWRAKKRWKPRSLSEKDSDRY